MALASGVSAYKSTLQSTFTNVQGTLPIDAATAILQGGQTFAMTGVPMTVATGLLAPGQAVSGFVTASPGSVTASGIGGIDVPSPGMGLAAAKAILIADLTVLFSNVTQANTYVFAATTISNAVLAFLSQAMVMTNVTGIVPPGSPVPPTSGPVGPGTYTGTGIGSLESTSGAGMASVVTALIAALTAEFLKGFTVAQAMTVTPATIAAFIADKLESLYLAIMVNTTDSGSAVGGPAVVDPITGSGSTLPPGSPSTGTGTGAIT